MANVTDIKDGKKPEDLRASLLKTDDLPKELLEELAKGRNFDKYENIEKIIEDLGGIANLNEIIIAYWNRHEDHLPRQSLIAGLGNWMKKPQARITAGEKQGQYILKPE